MARGLGSSSACIVAGLMGANELLGRPLPKDEIIDIAAVIEGHPDNCAPAVEGGFVAAVLEEGHVSYVRMPVSHQIRFCAFIPDFELRTDQARAALPATVARRDAHL
jgi:homoserine kinase